MAATLTLPFLFSAATQAQVLPTSSTGQLGTWSQTPGVSEAWVEAPPADFQGDTGLSYNVWRAVPADASLGQTIKFGDLTNTYMPNGAQYFSDRNKSISELLSSQGLSTQSVDVNSSSYTAGLTLGEVINSNGGTLPSGLESELRGAASFTQVNGFSESAGGLRQILADHPELKEIPLAELATGNFQGALDVGIQRGAKEAMENLPAEWKNLPIGSLTGSLLDGNYKAALRTGIQYGGQKLVGYILNNSALKNLPIGAFAKNLPISELGNITKAPLSTLPRIGSQYISKIPGLKNASIIQAGAQFAITLAKGDIAVKLDVSYAGKKEQPTPNAFTGGTPDNVPTPTPCVINSKKKKIGKTDNCPHFEMGYMNAGINKGRYKGQQMVDGQHQWAKGGKGVLSAVNKGWEPTGWKPFGDANGYNPAKLSLKNIKEAPGKGKRAEADIQLDLQICVKLPFFKKKGRTCTPHIIPVPTSFKARQNEWLLVLSSGSPPKMIQDAIDGLSNRSDYCDYVNQANGQAPSGTTPTVVASNGGSSAAPSNNQRQYLARIAAGESSGGSNIGAPPSSGSDAPYGEYQFRGSTRQAVLNQYPNLDAWSPDKSVRDKAALAWIGMYGNEIGVDILGAIQKGDFTTADRALGKNQFTSLPGGSEASPIWSNPANLTKFGAGGSGGTASSGSGENCSNGTGSAGGSSSGAYTGKTSGAFSSPANGPMTSGFGQRESPGGIGSTNHMGIDYGVDYNAPIKAAANGKIVYQGWYGGYGNTIFVDHGNGTMSQYSHLNGFVSGVGSTVPQGAVIGLAGSTGNSTGPHLHFAVLQGTSNGDYRTGNYVDPRNFLR
jgi:murein DD-endopeptidase MepM/ murein hydrolase activator NlpD